MRNTLAGTKWLNGASVPEVPFALSILSLVVAVFALGWNVYRDVLLKARLRVTVSTMALLKGPEHVGTYLQLMGVNFGPGNLTISSISALRTSVWRRLANTEEHFQVLAGPYERLGDSLPIKLAVGERAAFMLSPDLYSEPWTQIGLQDTFGRIHWVSARKLRAARKQYFEQHPDASG